MRPSADQETLLETLKIATVTSAIMAHVELNDFEWRPMPEAALKAGAYER